MIQVVRASQRHFSDLGWLKSHWLFSVSDYYDPQNIQFGPLRVFNDDTIEPGAGYPMHRHEEMEVVSMVLDGEITQKDSLGRRAVLKAGDVQVMSAGRGLSHSECNSGDGRAHFYQIWLYPSEAGLEPAYDEKSFQPSDWRNRLLPVASGQAQPEAARLHADSTIYRARFASGEGINYGMDETRRVFIYVRAGQINFDDTRIYEGDQARIDLETNLAIEAYGATEFVLIDVPSSKGWGIDEAVLKGAKAEELMKG